MVSKTMRPKAAAGPVKVMEPAVHQWGYERYQSEITPTLPPRPQNWPFAALGIPAAAAVMAGVEMVSGFAEALPPTVACGVLGAVGVTALGLRHKERGAISDRATEDIAVHVSTYLTRKSLKVLRWEGGWIGYSAKVRIRYAQGAADNPSLRSNLADLLERRFGKPYRLVGDNPRRRQLVFEVTEPVVEEEPRSDPLKEDVEAVLATLLPGAQVTELDYIEFSKPQEAEKDGPVVGKDSGEEGSPQLDVSRFVFTWPPQAAVRASAPAFQGRISKILQGIVGRPITIDFDLTTRTGYAESLTPLPDKIPHPPRNPSEPMKVVFGQFRGGSPCIWDLDAPLPHLLIVAGTGAGKTILILTLLTGLPIGRAKILPIDPKRIGLFNIGLIPGARNAATSERGIVDTLLEVKAEMDRRYTYLESEGPHLRESLDPLILVIDEGEEMNDMLADWWASGEGKEDWKARFDLEKAPTGGGHPVMKVLGSILRLGREARVHVILASQQASAAWLSTSSRSQFAVRIALRNLEATTSMMHFGTPIATSGLENKPGRAWVSLGMGVVPEHAQIYWTPKFQTGLNDDDRTILHGLGITLPDDEGFTGAPAEADPSAAVDPAPSAHQGKAAQVVETEPKETEADGRWETVAVPVPDVEDGTRFLVEVGGITVPATVESVEPDGDDPDCLSLSYLTDDGRRGVLSLADDGTVPVLVSILCRESKYDEKSEEAPQPSYSEYASARMVPAELVDAYRPRSQSPTDADETVSEPDGHADEPTQLHPTRTERQVLQISRGRDSDDIQDNVAYLPTAREAADDHGEFLPEVEYGLEAQAPIEDIQPGALILIDESAGTWAVVTEEGMEDDEDDSAWALLCVTEDGEETALVTGIGEMVTYRSAI